MAWTIEAKIFPLGTSFFLCTTLSLFLVCGVSACGYSDEIKDKSLTKGPSTLYLYESCTGFLKSGSDGSFSPSEGYCENFIRSYFAGYAASGFIIASQMAGTKSKNQCDLQEKNSSLRDIATKYLQWVDKKNADESKQYDPMQIGAIESFGQMIVECQVK